MAWKEELMAKILDNLGDLARLLRQRRGLVLPVAVVAMVFVLLVPLPPALMDVLLSANIAIAAIILLTALFVSRPLEFSSFPSVLLITTLLRLVLNVATTRLILTSGEGGRAIEEAQFAAGRVLWSFSQFVAAGSLAVGVVVFIIIVIIQFIVVMKGATRISEVAARFILDAMPGKQMAVDSELSSGAIDAAQARQKRATIAREADFYGAMDGASKYLRGDAIAAILILGVNIIGGLYVGLMQYGWSLSETANLFTRLTIGDGLVTQIPAFIMSLAAAMMVSRSNTQSNLGEEVVSQLTSRPVAIAITAGFLGLLALTSLPKAPLLLIGAGCGGLAWMLRGRQGTQSQGQQNEFGQTVEGGEGPAGQIQPGQPAQNVKELLAMDAIQLEMGFALVGLVDSPEKGGMLQRISALRKQIATELGFIVPSIRIRDNMDLAARSYAITIRGVKVASGQLHPNQLLAVGGENVDGSLMGRKAVEPAFGGEAVWISPSQHRQAEAMGYTVIGCDEVLLAHLAEVIRLHAAELLNRQQVVTLLENLKAAEANLVGEVASKLTYAQIQKVLQNLLRERVSIRNLETILEALCDSSCQTSAVEELTEDVRSALGKSLCQGLAGEDGKLAAVCLSSELEEELGEYVAEAPRWGAANVPAELSSKVTKVIAEELAHLRKLGRRPVVVCAPQLRVMVRRLISASLPEAAVLGYNEIDSVEVQPVASVGI